MRIVPSSDRRAVAALLSASRVRDRATDRQAQRIVDGVRRGGDAALIRYAQRLDGLAGSIEVTRERWEREARALAPAIRRAIANAARHITSVARRQVPKGWPLAHWQESQPAEGSRACRNPQRFAWPEPRAHEHPVRVVEPDSRQAVRPGPRRCSPQHLPHRAVHGVRRYVPKNHAQSSVLLSERSGRSRSRWP